MARGHTLWWRNSLDCPECAFEGKSTLMAARMSNDVLVDQCPEHGVWLDRGELGRLMGVPTDELAALRDRLAVMAPNLEQLVARREKWRADIETRRKAALDYRQALEEEHRRRVAIAEAGPGALARSARRDRDSASATLYGSYVRGEFIGKTSDIVQNGALRAIESAQQLQADGVYRGTIRVRCGDLHVQSSG